MREVWVNVSFKGKLNFDLVKCSFCCQFISNPSTWENRGNTHLHIWQTHLSRLTVHSSLSVRAFPGNSSFLTFAFYNPRFKNVIVFVQRLLCCHINSVSVLTSPFLTALMRIKLGFGLGEQAEVCLFVSVLSLHRREVSGRTSIHSFIFYYSAVRDSDCLLGVPGLFDSQ